MKTYQIEITESQHWWITKALVELTTEDGIRNLLAEFPDMDEDAAGEDLQNLMRKMANNSSQLP